MNATPVLAGAAANKTERENSQRTTIKGRRTEVMPSPETPAQLIENNQSRSGGVCGSMQPPRQGRLGLTLVSSHYTLSATDFA
jgi:hypothetical protein